MSHHILTVDSAYTAEIPITEIVDSREAALLRELRQAMITQDFMHWRKRGREVWIAKITAVLDEIEFPIE
jgi:hypothetical protein